MQDKYIYNYFSRIYANYDREDLRHNSRRIFDLAYELAKMVRDFDCDPLAVSLSNAIVRYHCGEWERLHPAA